MNPMKWLTLVLLTSVLHGCASVEKPSSTAAYPPPPVHQPVNEYYYYIEAQLLREKNKPEEAIALLQKAIETDPGTFFLKKELAFLHMDRKEFDKAAQLMQAVIDKDPRNVEAMVMLGSIRQELNQEEEAIRLYEMALNLDPERENLYLVLGSLYMGRNDHGGAIRVYRNLIEKFEDSYVGRFFLARSLTSVGAYREAEKEFYETLANRPDLVEPRFELIELYTQRPDDFQGIDIRARVIELYGEILAQQPRNVRASVELGLYFHESGMAADAARHLVELGRQSDSDMDIARFIARQYIETEQYKKAAALIEGMLAGAGDKSYLHYLCGFAYDNLNDKQKALDHFKRVTPESRFHKESTFRIAYIHHELGQSAESIRYLNDLIAREPGNADFQLYLAIIHEELEELDRAGELLQKAIRLSPDSANLYFRLGVVYDKQGKRDESIEQMKAAIRLDPEDPNALNYLGYTYAEMGVNLDEAETLIVKALNLKPEDGYITDSLGWVYYQKGQYEKALEILKRAVSLVEDDPVILEHIGDAYVKTGLPARAIEYYERALEAGPRKPKDIQRKIQDLMNQEF